MDTAKNGQPIVVLPVREITDPELDALIYRLQPILDHDLKGTWKPTTEEKTEALRFLSQIRHFFNQGGARSAIGRQAQLACLEAHLVRRLPFQITDESIVVLRAIALEFYGFGMSWGRGRDLVFINFVNCLPMYRVPSYLIQYPLQDNTVGDMIQIDENNMPHGMRNHALRRFTARK